ncbi:MAG: phosphoribosylanthranilate isomerase [Cucumibacter sp.]
MSLVVKICGLKDESALDAAIAAGADMVGFVHFAKSPRHLPLGRIGELVAYADGRAETVALLVDPDPELVEAVAALRPDWLQLHGAESIETVEATRAISGRKVMKALPVERASDLVAIGAYFGVADRIMLDAKPPPGAERPGGLGRAFDWTILDAIDPNVPFMLAGGLNPENIGAAMARVRPFGVDVSSGVESAPGVKDPEKIKAFIAAARAAERAGSKVGRA